MLTEDSRPILEFDRVTMKFSVGRGILNRRMMTAVDDVTMAIPPGMTVGVVGESGSGKSTLARIALGLLEPTAGDVRIDGRSLGSRTRGELRAMRRSVQPVFQDPSSSLNPRQTVERLVSTPFIVHRDLAPADARSAVVEALERVGLGAEHLKRFPHELSGGQRQRVAIARAIILRPRLIIADEPTSALDVSIQAQIVRLLRKIQSESGCSLVFISHNLGIVRHLADWVAVMYLGRIVELGDNDSVFRQPCHPYTRLLIDSVPSPDPRLRASSLGGGGGPVSHVSTSGGCRFSDRCPECFARCLDEDPRDVRLSDLHQGACHLLAPQRGGAIDGHVKPLPSTAN